MHERIVFMGTPDFAVPALRMLADRVPNEQLLVVTQPDRAAGRGRQLQAPPVKTVATELGLDTIQVETMKDPESRARLVDFAPDLAVVAAFGRILPKWFLDLPGKGCVNLHASDLPRFRGASPIPAAIVCGDESTAVALMQMEPGLDTGDVYARTKLEIDAGDTTETLTVKLARAGADLLDNNLDDLLAGSAEAEQQKGAIVETRKIRKEHGAVDWSSSAEEIERHVRAMWPWPRAWTSTQDGMRLQIHRADIVDGGKANETGEVLGSDDDGILVSAGDGVLRLLRIQLPGKAAQEAIQLRQHPAFTIGSHFQSADSESVSPWIIENGEA